MKMISTLLGVVPLISAALTSSLFADSIEIINRNNEIVKIEFYKPMSSPIFGDLSASSYTLNDIDTMLASIDLMNRALAAAVVAKGMVADTAKCTKLLVDALDDEINNPFPQKLGSDVSARINDFLLGQYLYDIRVLLHTKGPALIEQYIPESTGELRTLLILALGLLGERDMRDSVRNIYSESENGFVRFQAIQVMNIFPDTLDIPVLREALKDEYYAEDTFGNKTRLIVGTAKGGLIKLGFSIQEVEKLQNEED